MSASGTPHSAISARAPTVSLSSCAAGIPLTDLWLWVWSAICGRGKGGRAGGRARGRGRGRRVAPAGNNTASGAQLLARVRARQA